MSESKMSSTPAPTPPGRSDTPAFQPEPLSVHTCSPGTYRPEAAAGGPLSKRFSSPEEPAAAEKQVEESREKGAGTLGTTVLRVCSSRGKTSATPPASPVGEDGDGSQRPHQGLAAEPAAARRRS